MLSQKLILELEKYIDEHRSEVESFKSMKLYHQDMDVLESQVDLDLENFIEKKRKPSFQTLLLTYIDQSRSTDSEIYKRAGLDRRHFSKIRSNIDYQPSKRTVLSLALALELSKEHTEQLLHAAGYSLSDSDTFDLIIQFCLEKEIYDRFEVNNMLDYFKVKTLN